MSNRSDLDRPATIPRPAVAAGLVVGVAAVSSAAVLIRVADAPPLAIAFWRCLGGSVALAPFALRARAGRSTGHAPPGRSAEPGHAPPGRPAGPGTDAPPVGRSAEPGTDAPPVGRPAGPGTDPPPAGRRRPAPLEPAQRRQLIAAGLFLALHFALWIGSLELTTVASSVTLVTMSPVFVGLGATWFLRESPTRRTWVGMAVTIAGALIIGAADLGDADLGPRAVLGDAMALGGAAAVSGYLLIGRAARRRLPVTMYASSVYGVAAAALLVACLATGSALTGYDAGTWWALAGLVVGPQLLGHTVFNALLSTVTATVVSIVVLAEPVGATLLAWVLLGELPTELFWVGAPLILLGVFAATVRRGGGGRPATEAVPAEQLPSP